MSNFIGNISLLCAIACLDGCATAPSVGPPQSDWAGECYHSFNHDVDFVAGPNALDCGLLPRTYDASKQESIKQCTKRALATGKPFKAGYASYGDDSAFCDVVVRSKDGQLWSVYYDADIAGGSGKPEPALWVSRCTGLIFEPGTIGRGSYFKLDGCSQDKDIVPLIVKDRKAQP